MEAAAEKTLRGQRTKRRKAVVVVLLAVVLFLGERWVWRQVQFLQLRVPLIKAVEDADTATVRTLLEQGADPDIRTDYTEEAFTWASIVQRLRGGKPAAPSRAETVLIHAVLKNQTDIVQLLLEHGADVSLIDNPDMQMTALEWACMSGNCDCVKMLIAHEANVNGRVALGYTTLFAAIMGDSVGEFRKPYLVGESCVELLLQNGAKVHVQDNNGYTPLIFAAGWSASSEGSPTLRLLLAQGADLETRDKEGKTALLHAVWHANLDAVRTLLQSGAEIDVQDTFGKTALMYAVEGALEAKTPGTRSRFFRADREAYLAAIQRLLDHGADVRPKDNTGKTALQMAESFHDTAILALLHRKVKQTEWMARWWSDISATRVRWRFIHGQAGRKPIRDEVSP